MTIAQPPAPAGSATISVAQAFQLAATYLRNGQPDAAENLCREILSVDPRHADSLHLLGAIADRRGHHDRAVDLIGQAIASNDGVAAFHVDMGNALAALDKPAEAVRCYERALAITSTYPGIYYRLGRALQTLGRLAEAVSRYEQALAIKSAYPEVLSSLGLALQGLGQLDQAIASYDRALALQPENPLVLCNLATALQSQGQLDAAIARYRQALALRTDFPEVHCNLGSALQAQGRLDQAIDHFERALAIQPDFAGARLNLGSALFAQGKPDQAMMVLLPACRAAETATAVKILFCQCLRYANLSRCEAADLDTIHELAVQAVAAAWTRPTHLAEVCLRLMARNRTATAVIAQGMSIWPQRLPEPLVADVWQAFFSDPLLVGLLKCTTIPDLALERFLTSARHAMLCRVSDDRLAEAEGFLAGLSALAQQCFVNEYVFPLTPDELDRVAQLRAALVAALAAGTAIAAHRLAILAAYLPLHSLPQAAQLPHHAWPPAVAEILRQQVQEPAEELRLMQTIPCLTRIDDETSVAVRAQYEQNPYPRWTTAPLALEMPSTYEFLRQVFPRAAIRADARSAAPSILIAGCGTGLHIVEVARRFPQARILAIDLSRSSLGYAKRKLLELGLGNVDCAQADILELGDCASRFDLIESAGVLHHLAAPMQGWQVLLKLLRPNGFMCVGLYSELARQNVVAARSFIGARGDDGSADNIRRCRQDLMAAHPASPWYGLLKSSDFYSISGCRDLLFHVREHRLSVPTIQRFLSANDLAFIGFQVPPHIEPMYLAMFPDNPAMNDLDLWHRFELAHPTTFGGMYQFWVQKPG